MVDEQKPEEQNQPEVVPEVVAPEVVPEVPVVEEEVDDKGVSYKNRAAEAQRKLQQKEEELEELRFRVQNIESRIPQTPIVPKPDVVNTPQSKSDMDTFIQLGPDRYLAEKQQQMINQQKLVDAESLIHAKFPGRLQYGVSKVLDYAQKNLINVMADPVRAVTKILAEIEKPVKIVPTEEDKKKIAEAIKNKPESGKNTPPPPTPKKNAEVEENLKNRGSRDDAAAWLRENFKL